MYMFQNILCQKSYAKILGSKLAHFLEQMDPSGDLKDQEGKDRRRQLLYYVSLIRACNKVLYQLVYLGKKVCIP